MATNVTRRRRRRLLVPLLGVGVAVWAVRRRLDNGQRLDQGWHELPPASWPVPDSPTPAPRHPAPAPAVRSAAVPSPVEQAPALPLEQAAAPRAVPVATAMAAVAAPALPEAPFGPGSVCALSDGSSPDPAGFAVKGKTATKVFHAPGGAYYTRTRADVWFRTADDARAAGFTERGPRRHR
jgi:hypothetical protein